MNIKVYHDVVSSLYKIYVDGLYFTYEWELDAAIKAAEKLSRGHTEPKLVYEINSEESK